MTTEDRRLNPHTGYTRRHWEAIADGLVEAAWRWASPRGARLDLPGPPSSNGARSDGLEGYARTFLAAAFRIAGAGGDDPHDWLPRYAEGLRAGTRAPGRDDADSWPTILDHDVAGQPMVESASVAIGLRLTRPWLWDRLDEPAQDRVENWLRGALRHVASPNNWYLFPFTVAGFLESVGRGDGETARARTRALELLDAWYRGDGWYSDGDGRAFDHYNGWALHLYPVLDAHLTGKHDVHGDRLRRHLADLSLMFGGDGAPLHFGRSLTYRFAAASAIGLGAVTGDTPLAPGVSRRLLSGALRHFVDRGAFSPDGLLSIGWHGPHRPTAQHYSGPGSPYWASKAFVCLLAPPDHPLWTDPELPAPVEEEDRVVALPAPGLLLQSTVADGIVRLHNHGSDHVRPEEGEGAAGDDPHYGRLAYSTHTGPTAVGNPADNHLDVIVDGVRSVRRRIHPLGTGPDWAASWHRPVFVSGSPMRPGLRVESMTLARGPWELRAHRIVAAPCGSRVSLTGWAVGLEATSELFPLHGWETPDEVRAPHGTAYTRWAVMPRLTADAEGTCLFAALALLTADLAPPSPPVVEVPEGDRIIVHWRDGSHTRISFEPLVVTHS
ncbi:DUF2264 domain-containing protein [Kutzneria sp. CA-103260]|uniref:DUF2264 domain-containing protein n=1 Tax=Kutzneria sp. CA-103260 TaxID=2802641 RepID=UPI001BA7235D|nr:DUF2264 domain-containing protein [Kutzneria sp. CA-103260]QUQ63634.1 hypothetical protein JJ691_13470 [Kutzneria sp. CA-103260]